jgi:DNA-binding MarR family transcriptional regulator
MAQRRVPTVGYLIWHLSIKWRVAVDRALSPLGMTHAHYSLLASLYALSRRGARPSQRELAEFGGLEVMYVSKLVRGLERSGLLRRTDHPDDPRAFQLELTAQGADLVVNAATVVRQLYDQLLIPIGGRSSKRTTALMRLLETLLEQAEGLDQPKGTHSPEVYRRTSPPVQKRRKTS